MEIKRVWFVSHYSMPPRYEMRVKTLRFAHYLGLRGVDCTIFTASTLHNTDINLITDKSLYIERQYDDLKYVHIRCCDYKKTDIKRIVNMEQFGYRFAKVAENFTPPDAIVSDTYCISYKPIYRYCKKHGIPFIVDVRDLWPQSIVEYLGFSEKNPIIRAMYEMEKNMYIRSDKIVFSFYGGYDYIINRGLDKIIPREKVHYINNGVDLDEFNVNREKYQIQDEDLEDDDLYKVVYVGSIRKVNNLGLLLDAAKEVKDSQVKFLVWGTGDEEAKLMTRVKNERITNVVFKGFIEKRYIPYIASKADLNLIHNNPSALFRYGISFNKIFDYLAAGKPTLSTFPCKYNPAVMAGAGFQVNDPTPKNIAKAIESIRVSPEPFGENAKNAAREYDLSVLTQKLYDIILDAVSD